jgi:phosphoenolpyruvate carboxylase
MGEAIGKNDYNTINHYIQQLGLTPFFNKKQPTPTDEALNLMWYLENIFYHSIGNIYNTIVSEVFDNDYESSNPFIELGFWPGGDRDGNPFVNASTTIKVAQALRSSIIVCYYRDVRKLKRKLTFSGVDSLINSLEASLYENVFRPDQSKPITVEEIIGCLTTIRKKIIDEYHSLYLSRLDSLLNKVRIFGTHFASLDIRQDSRIHRQVLLDVNKVVKEKSGKAFLPEKYLELSAQEQIASLTQIKDNIDSSILVETISIDTIESIYEFYNEKKTEGNEFFAKGDYLTAYKRYERPINAYHCVFFLKLVSSFNS